MVCAVINCISPSRLEVRGEGSGKKISSIISIKDEREAGRRMGAECTGSDYSSTNGRAFHMQLECKLRYAMTGS